MHNSGEKTRQRTYRVTTRVAREQLMSDLNDPIVVVDQSAIAASDVLDHLLLPLSDGRVIAKGEVQVALPPNSTSVRGCITGAQNLEAYPLKFVGKSGHYGVPGHLLTMGAAVKYTRVRKDDFFCAVRGEELGSRHVPSWLSILRPPLGRFFGVIRRIPI